MKDNSQSQIALAIPFHSIRNITSPEDTQNRRIVYAGQLPIKSILDLPTHENVRGYLVEAEGKQRRVKTQVHRAIEETLKERPDSFSVLNGGVVIVARDSEIDEKQKLLKLSNPSIINGSQTQGVVRDFLLARASDSAAADIHIKFELIVTVDDELIADISISRNFQNDVRNLSIAGRKGQLDELEESLQKQLPDIRLQKSETQLPADGNGYLETEKLLQVIAALLPKELWWKQAEYNKTYTYHAKAVCLKDFQEIYKRAKDTNDPDHGKFQDVYHFYLDVSAQAWRLYDRWKRHQGFTGTGLRSIEREGREVVDVPDGIIFPIIASLAEFAVRTKSGWKISAPEQLDDSELIRSAKSAYMEIAKSKPEIMGKTKACYSALQQITSIYKKLLQND
jgi:AIPR protein